MSKKIAFQTLGCRLNSHETDSLIARFAKAGYEVVPFDQVADAYVINTCTVTAKSDRKSRNFINRARKETQALVVVTGCYVDNAKDKLEADGLTYLVENDQKAHVFELVDSHFRGETIHPSALKADRFGFNEDENPLHTRAVVKVQDGCNNFCTYCIIPHVRGRAVSRKLADIVDQSERLVKSGFKEIILTGINISRYNENGLGFTDVLKAVIAIPGDFRVHIPSMEPENVTDEFIELLASSKLCNHIHLCLQTGSDTVLKAMNRKYTVSEYLNIVKRIKEKSPLFNITTDLIVGFPGETDEDFAQTMEVVKGVGYGHIHTFKYSRREGTPAAKIKEQLPEKLKSERSSKLRRLSDQLKLSYREELLDLPQRVLIEKVADGVASGYSEYYVPVHILNSDLSENSFIDVTPTRLEDIKGEMVLVADLKQ